MSLNPKPAPKEGVRWRVNTFAIYRMQPHQEAALRAQIGRMDSVSQRNLWDQANAITSEAHPCSKVILRWAKDAIGDLSGTADIWQVVQLIKSCCQHIEKE